MNITQIEAGCDYCPRTKFPWAAVAMLALVAILAAAGIWAVGLLQPASVSPNAILRGIDADAARYSALGELYAARGAAADSARWAARAAYGETGALLSSAAPGAAQVRDLASFGDSAMSIPGYNAPYPFLRALTYRGAPSGSWSVTAPRIPGYSDGELVAGDALMVLRGLGAEVPQVPGYNAPYPVLRTVTYLGASSAPWSVTAPRIPGYSDGAIVDGDSLVALQGLGAEVPQVPGYNAPYPVFRAVTYLGAPSGSWSVTAPRIPGYSAGYPVLGGVASND